MNHLPMDAGTQCAALNAAVVGQVVIFHVTAVQTGSYEHRYCGPVARIVAADATAATPRRVVVRLTHPTASAGREDVFPIAHAGIAIVSIELVAVTANPFLDDILGGEAMPDGVGSIPTLRNPLTWRAYIVAPDEDARIQKRVAFESFIRCETSMTGESNRDRLRPGADFEVLRVNGQIRQLVAWVTCAQQNPNWRAPWNIAMATEALIELEAWNVELTNRSIRKARADKKGPDAGPAGLSREQGVARWQNMVREIVKEEALGDWERAVLKDKK